MSLYTYAALRLLEPPFERWFFPLDFLPFLILLGGATNDCPHPAHRTFCPRISPGIDSVTWHLGFGHCSFVERMGWPPLLNTLLSVRSGASLNNYEIKSGFCPMFP